MSSHNIIDIQLALLEFFGNGKPVRNAIRWPGLEKCTRQEIKDLKDSFVKVGILRAYPSGKCTSRTMYKVTDGIGQAWIKLLKEMK